MMLLRGLHESEAQESALFFANSEYGDPLPEFHSLVTEYGGQIRDKDYY
jgi:hypothetical protein